MVQGALVRQRHLGAGGDATMGAPVPVQPTDELGQNQHLAQTPYREVNRLRKLYVAAAAIRLRWWGPPY
jgi:hypothetical protein